MADLSQVQARFSIPDALRFEADANGMIRAVVSTPQAEAVVYLHGGHVTHFQPAGERPLLFLSGKSQYSFTKAIRGGVPVIFPWFGAKRGNPMAPMHGFARTSGWIVTSAEREADGSVSIVLHLQANDATRKSWPHEFAARYRVVVGPSLSLTLEVRNTSGDVLEFEEALHTYLRVGSIHETKMSGLEGARYIDKTEGNQRKTEGAEPIRINGETDRVYLNTQATCIVEDEQWRRRIIVEKAASNSTVVWNPWIEKAQSMADFGDEEWVGMVCIETANAADNAVKLQPGLRHEMRAVIRAESMG